MLKKVWRLKLYQHPEKKVLYEEKVKNMWPELKDHLRNHGVRKYSIFLDHETHNIFIYIEVSGEQQSEQLQQDPLVRKWWQHLSDTLFTNPDGTPMRIELTNLLDFDE